MISFKLFVEAIHHAIVSASDSLMDKNEGLLDKYFEKPVDGEGKNKGALVPKIVQLEYPTLDDAGAVTQQNAGARHRDDGGSVQQCESDGEVTGVLR